MFLAASRSTSPRAALGCQTSLGGGSTKTDTPGTTGTMIKNVEDHHGSPLQKHDDKISTINDYML